MKQHYRTFNIRSEDLTPGDDYGMMREVLQRRFARLVKEAPRAGVAGGEDGGRRAQRAADRTRRPDLPARLRAWPTTAAGRRRLPGLARSRADRRRQGAARGGARRRWRRSASRDDVALVGIAKGRDRDAGRETFFMPGQPPFKLPPRDPALYFVQRLRDEAHRFAIGTHRAKRKREMVEEPARRDPRHRPGPQAGAAAPFRHRQGDRARRARGPRRRRPA